MNSPRSQPRAAFSLIELLVVIGILAIMAAAGAMALGGSGGKSLKGSAAAASSISRPARKRSSPNGAASGCGSPRAIVWANTWPEPGVALNPP